MNYTAASVQNNMCTRRDCHIAICGMELFLILSLIVFALLKGNKFLLKLIHRLT